MTQRNRSTPAVCTAVLLTSVLLTAPAAADWLVTREGGRVETKGPWQVKGKLVVFTLPDGKLSSLRLSEVDLDVSRRVTAEAAAAAQAPPPPAQPAKPREAKVVLTDESFKRVAPPAPAPPGEETKEGEAAGATDPSRLVVASWERAQGSNGSVVITGTVRNDAPSDAISSAVTVLLYDETGKLIVSGDAVLSSTILPAGQTGSFRAEFPDVFTFGAVKFEAQGLHVQTKPNDAVGNEGETPAKN